MKISNFKFQISNFKMGFTLVELAVVGSIILTLLGLIAINLASSQGNASLASQEEILLADLKQQQLKSMVGDTEGRSDADPYGIHFDSSKYTLFHGDYSEAESSNVVINLPDTISFDAESRPEIIFEKVKGEVRNFSTGPDKIILEDTTNGSTKTIKFNKYGVVYQIE